MMIRLSLLAVLALAACGVDGAPERPAQKPAKSGVTISGDARVGVSAQL
ncbi:hypothetical protein [Paracoccus sp. R86501]